MSAAGVTRSSCTGRTGTQTHANANKVAAEQHTHTHAEPNYEIHLIALLVATSNQLHDEYLICWIVIEFQKNGPIGQLDIRHATNSTVDTLRGNYASQLTNWSVIVLSQLPCRFDILSFFTESHWNHNYPYCR